MDSTRPRDSAPTAGSAAESDRFRILAVEDNEDTQTLLRYLLEPRFNVDLVPRIEDALDIADGNGFDLFLLDINLGEKRTGIDLLHRLRANPVHRDTPALALTAYAMPGDREKFLKAGFDAYVSKPFTRNELLEAIQILVRTGTRRS